MNFFHHSEAVRLRSHHNKYLTANPDGTSVSQHPNGSSRSSIWTIEPIPGTTKFIRLKSFFGKYLTASNKPLFFGFAGQKVTQTAPSRLDSSLEWEPISDGARVKLKTRYSLFLKANSNAPPWRTAVTHDIPTISATRDWILWSVDSVNLSPLSSPLAPLSPRFSSEDLSDSSLSSAPRSEGRVIYYHTMEQGGELDDTLVERESLMFEGNSVAELTRRLMEKTGLHNVVVCTMNQVSRKLYPLRLQLPPSNSDMHLIVVSIQPSLGSSSPPYSL